MASLNQVTLIGNLTRKPEIRYTPKDTAVGDISIAINSSYKDQQGTVHDEVCYVDIVAWGRQAETAQEFLDKGAPILVEGRLQLDQWETKEGEKKSRLRVRADRITFLNRAPNREGGGGDREGFDQRPERQQRSEGRQAPAQRQPPASRPPPPGDDFHDSHPDDDVPF